MVARRICVLVAPCGASPHPDRVTRRRAARYRFKRRFLLLVTQKFEWKTATVVVLVVVAVVVVVVVAVVIVTKVVVSKVAYILDEC